MTSQEIDDLCEGDNIPLARRIMDSILNDLRRAFRKFAELGVKHIIVAADHGFIFGDELGSDMKVDPPGGETVDLHRRVWVGRGGAMTPAFLREKASDFGFSGDLEIAAPWNFACFKVPGGTRAYFHGGMSLQELAIPVLHLTPKVVTPAKTSEDAQWTLVLGSKKISTRFFSVQVQAVLNSFLDFKPPKVRIEIRAKGQCISVQVSASYGFEDATKEVQMRMCAGQERTVEPNTVTLMISAEGELKTASIHLLDAISGMELARQDGVEMSISI